MDEQFILRVTPSIAERIEQLLNENPSSSEDGSLDLSFSGMYTGSLWEFKSLMASISWPFESNHTLHSFWR